MHLASEHAQAQLDPQVSKVAIKPLGIKVSSPFSQAAHDSRVVEYVDRLLRDMDKNTDGFIDAEEQKAGRWNTPAEESDTDKDARLSKPELLDRIAKRFGLVSFNAATADAAPTKGKKLIAFEVVLIDRPPSDVAGEQGQLPTAAELLALEKKGKLPSVQRLKLSVLENVESRMQFGEDAPLVTSRTSRGGGGGFGGGGGMPVSESVSYQSLGTMLTVTAEVDADGKVIASLSLQRSSLAPSKPVEKVEGQEAASPPAFPRKLTSTINTATRLAPGETAVLCGQQTQNGNTPGELWVLVSAKVE
ncbi:hypothetical protein NA78x_003253 [Anatilimnocola sp. NA78]|uniref:hypothetical protein n=1 Tax=Anatilimnocola sp. NA78 TaxID=3415683 RepID=UPI003CE5BDAF